MYFSTLNMSDERICFGFFTVCVWGDLFTMNIHIKVNPSIVFCNIKVKKIMNTLRSVRKFFFHYYIPTSASPVYSATLHKIFKYVIFKP